MAQTQGFPTQLNQLVGRDDQGHYRYADMLIERVDNAADLVVDWVIVSPLGSLPTDDETRSS